MCIRGSIRVQAHRRTHARVHTSHESCATCTLYFVPCIHFRRCLCVHRISSIRTVSSSRSPVRRRPKGAKTTAGQRAETAAAATTETTAMVRRAETAAMATGAAGQAVVRGVGTAAVARAMVRRETAVAARRHHGSTTLPSRTSATRRAVTAVHRGLASSTALALIFFGWLETDFETRLVN